MNNEDHATWRWMFGVVHGLAQCGIELRKRCGEMFAAGKDDEAKLVRGLAMWAEEQAETVRQNAVKFEHEANKDDEL